jgi:hypothetical protein
MVYNSSSAACPSKQPAPKTRFIALLRARPRNLSTIFGKILRDLFCTFHKNFLRPVCASPAERFLEVGCDSACSRNFFRPRLPQTGGHSDGEFLASAENDRHSADTRCGERANNAYAAVSDARADSTSQSTSVYVAGRAKYCKETAVSGYLDCFYASPDACQKHNKSAE